MLQMGQYDRAIADLSRYLQLQSARRQGFQRTRARLPAQGRTGSGAGRLRGRDQDQPFLCRTAEQSGVRLCKAGQTRSRRSRAIRRRSAVSPRNRLAHSNRGDAYEAGGQYDKALSDYKIASEGPLLQDTEENRQIKATAEKRLARLQSPDRRRQGHAEGHGGGRTPRRARHCQQRLRACRRAAQSRQRRQGTGRRPARAQLRRARSLRRRSVQVRQSAQGLRRPRGRRRLGRHLFRRPRHGDRRHQLPHSRGRQTRIAAPRRGRGDAAGTRAGQGCGRRQDAARHPRCLPQQSVRRQDAPVRPGDTRDQLPGSLPSNPKAASSLPMRHATGPRRSTERPTVPSWKRSCGTSASRGSKSTCCSARSATRCWRKPGASRSRSPTVRCPPSRSSSGGRAHTCHPGLGADHPRRAREPKARSRCQAPG